MRRIGWQPKGCKCTSRDHCSYRRAYHEGCRARPSRWRLWAQGDRGQLEAAARFAPCDQSAGGGGQDKSKFFVRGAREILKIATAAEMPQHGVDLASGVTHDRHTNDYATSHTGPALAADAIILKRRVIDTRVGSFGSRKSPQTWCGQWRRPAMAPTAVIWLCGA